MNCKSCGAALAPGEKFCSKCGSANTAEPQSMGMNMQQVEQMNGDILAGSETPMSMNSLMSSPTNNMQAQPMGGQVPMGGQAPMGMAPQMGYQQPQAPMGMAPQMGFQQPQQPMGGQAPMGMAPQAPMGYAQPMGGPQKKNNFAIIAIVAVVAVALIIGVVLLTKDKKEEPKGEDPNKVVPVAENYTNVTYSGFTFKISDKYIYEIDSQGLVLSDNKEWVARVQVGDYAYSQIKSALPNAKTTLARQGYTVGVIDTKTFGGAEYSGFNIKYGSLDHYIAYTKASSTKTFGVELALKTGTPSADSLKSVAEILKTASYVGGSQSISTLPTVDGKMFNDVTKNIEK